MTTHTLASVYHHAKASISSRIDLIDVNINCCSTHWGRVTHICVSKLTIIGSDNVLSPGRRQAIIWNNAGILLIKPLGTYLSEILSEIHTFSFRKMHLKTSSAKWRPFCLGLNVLNADNWTIVQRMLYQWSPDWLSSWHFAPRVTLPTSAWKTQSWPEWITGNYYHQPPFEYICLNRSTAFYAKNNCGSKRPGKDAIYHLYTAISV